jgi:hypothetical protein
MGAFNPVFTPDKENSSAQLTVGEQQASVTIHEEHVLCTDYTQADETTQRYTTETSILYSPAQKDTAASITVTVSEKDAREIDNGTHTIHYSGGKVSVDPQQYIPWREDYLESVIATLQRYKCDFSADGQIRCLESIESTLKEAQRHCRPQPQSTIPIGDPGVEYRFRTPRYTD